MQAHEVVFAARGALLILAGLDARKVRVEALERREDGSWRFVVSAERGESRRYVELRVRDDGGVELVSEDH